MKISFNYLFVFIIFFMIITLLIPKNRNSIFFVPKGWPKPNYNFSKNNFSLKKFELGRKLFYDPILSKDSTISCASCHLQYSGFSHTDHNVSHGIDGKKGTRNGLALINLAWNKTFHWDGGVNNLEMQAINPITHPNEMGNSLNNLILKLNSNFNYKNLFFKAYNDSIIDSKNLLKALASFTVSLVSYNSKYDKYIRHEKGGTFSIQELNGLKLFRTFCSNCHNEPLFTNFTFANNGLKIDPNFNDLGRYNITHIQNDSFKFKVPTLRNIEFTFPYMHDGRFNKLSEVINHYANINLNEIKQLNLDIKEPITITENQKKDLVAFLFTLTDLDFLYNKTFSYPFK